jgi:hypothetical protein
MSRQTSVTLNTRLRIGIASGSVCAVILSLLVTASTEEFQGGKGLVVEEVQNREAVARQVLVKFRSGASKLGKAQAKEVADVVVDEGVGNTGGVVQSDCCFSFDHTLAAGLMVKNSDSTRKFGRVALHYPKFPELALMLVERDNCVALPPQKLGTLKVSSD